MKPSRKAEVSQKQLAARLTLAAHSLNSHGLQSALRVARLRRGRQGRVKMTFGSLRKMIAEIVRASDNTDSLQFFGMRSLV